MKQLRLILAALCLAALAIAQTEPAKPAPVEPGKYYRLDFTVKEFEAGKVVNSHEYSISITESGRSTAIRSGERVPAGSEYLNVGTNIDCADLKPQGDRVSLRISADVTSAVKVESGTVPLLRHTSWDAHVLIPLRRKTVVFSSDNAAANGRMQMEITATPMN
jgi:hypothetical protein